MNPHILTDLLEKSFTDHGFNIFLTSKVKDLPEELSTFFSPEHNEKTLCLIGSGGPLLWKKITDFNIEDPIDSYTQKIMQKLGNELLGDDIVILHPGKPELYPLQRLGRALNYAYPSLLKIDLSYDFGPWFAYRGIFLTTKLIRKDAPLHIDIAPCENCLDKPCLPTLERSACSYKNEEKYSLIQQNYHQKHLAKHLSRC